MHLLDPEAGLQNPPSDDIAIVGLACRFPGDAVNSSALWDMLVQGRSAFTSVPKDKWNHEAHYHPSSERGGSTSIKGGHYLKENGAKFDAAFFNVTTTEAISMDLQQRIVMENVYEALENAGLRLEDVQGSNTSVFAGAFADDARAILDEDPDIVLKHKPTGTSNSIISNRVSWFYDLRGCSLTLDTACSSSLVAFHMACSDLRQKQSEMSIVCGVNVIESPKDMYRMSNLGFLSPDGMCFTFDSRANGYSRGEGVGTLVLKSLQAAIRDGDTIRAIVRGTGVNQDGRTPEMTLPNQKAQEELIRQVYLSAGLELADTGFVEAHGAGTLAGDLLESGAIASVWKERPSETPLYVGAGKTNLGHLEGASGVAALIKTILALENGIIPPNINFERVNPRIPCEKWKIQFPVSPTPWPSNGIRRASVNSFGFGGTNAHAVLDDAPSYLQERHLKGWHRSALPEGDRLSSSDTLHPQKHRIFVWSTQDEDGIKRTLSTFSDHLKGREVPEGYLSDLAFTLAEKRSRLKWRVTVAAGTVEELVETLSEPSTKTRAVCPTTVPSLGFVFTGPGAQWYAMGRELLAYPIFKESVELATDFIASLGCPWNVFEELVKSAEETKIDESCISQTLCTVLQVALVDLVSSWGITPARVVGHSCGEIAAAYCVGSLDQKSAWKVAYYRGLVFSKPTKTRGAMLAVGMSSNDIQPYIDRVNEKLSGELVVACYDSPKNITCSGDNAKIDLLKELVDADSIFARKLKVQNAYHSKHMQAVAKKYRSLLGELTNDTHTLDKEILAFSSVSGQMINAHDMGRSDYWVENLVSPVKFSQALRTMCTSQSSRSKLELEGGTELPVTQLVELGPHSALQNAVRDLVAADPSFKAIHYLSLLTEDKHAASTTLSAVGMLFASGYPVDLHKVNHSDEDPKMLIDLPSYAFNHDHEFWTESRRSKRFRFREHPRHDILGTTVPDWDPNEPKWRNYIRVSELPWLKDYKITGSIVLPGASYLVMAVEGIKQIRAPQGQITGFQLRDIVISRALQISEEDDTETMMSMRKAPESNHADSSIWWEFKITSYDSSEESWLEHCRGLVSAELASETGPIDAGREAAEHEMSSKNFLDQCETACQIKRDLRRQYSELERVGLDFGPLFQNLTEVKSADPTGSTGQVIGQISVPDIPSCMPYGYLCPHVIQPPTMDSMLQMFLFAFQASIGAGPLRQIMVPVAMKSVWISSAMETEPGHLFKSHCSASPSSHNRFSADITVWDEQSRDVRVILKGLEVVSLQESSSNEAGQRRLCYNVHWKPDVDLLGDQAQTCLREPLKELEANDLQKIERLQDLQLAAAIFITEAVESFSNRPPKDLPPHKQKYLEWLNIQMKNYKNEKLIHQCDEWDEIMKDLGRRNEFLKTLEASGPEGRLLVRMGSHIIPILRGGSIAPILRGEIDAHHLIFGMDDLSEEYHREMLGTDKIRRNIASYLDLLSHKRLDLRVLEIGAGTGGTSGCVLETLCPRGTRSRGSLRLLKYTYTDISAEFFEKAEAKFKKWRDVMEFRTLDVEKDPAAQGFDNGSYDIIVAANVLHATADLSLTLGNVRRLLKPGGKLLLHEITQPEFIAGPLCFGLLPTWWLSTEENRRWGPLLSESGWDAVLQANGFKGPVLALSDSLDPDLHAQSLLIASAPEEEEAPLRKIDIKPTLIVTSANPPILEQLVADDLAAQLMCLGVMKCKVVEFPTLPKYNLKDANCVVTMELEKPYLASSVPPKEFEILRQLLTTAKGILWVTKDPFENPDVALITGLLRSLRLERDLDGSNLVTLAFDTAERTKTDVTHHVARVHKHQFIEGRDRHAEYLVRGNVLCINRLVESPEVNDYICSACSKPAARSGAFGADKSRALMLSTASPGRLDELHFVDWPEWTMPLLDNHIEVEIKATGLNFRDVMAAMGEVTANTFGHEGAGIVRKVGANITDVKPGDRMLVLSALHGTFQTYTRTPREIAAKIPDDMSFEMAAGIPVIFSTAYYCLVEIARLRKGETCLIHAAAGGVGQAAVQLAKNIGAEIFATVSSIEKKDVLVNVYGIPEDHIFSSRDLSFAKGVMRTTNGRGVDVILNSLTGEGLRRSWDCIATFGRFIEIGKRDILANGRLEMYPFSRSVIFAACDLYTIMKLDAKTTARILTHVIELWQSGEIRSATPHTVYDYSQIEDAFQLLQTGRNIGKVVLKVNEEDTVKVIPKPRDPVRFREDASYVLSGGLGVLGRSIARWMAAQGVRNLIFLSRSGGASDAAQELLRDLEKAGVRCAVFACDVSDDGKLISALRSCESSGMPRVAGVIQGATQLKDSAFESMSCEDYKAGLAPKVRGTWNLHEYLPKDMDFFIMLSSICGIVGKIGQSQYAAGNTYQDALAQYRRSRGLPASTLDLGNVLTGGFISENQETLNSNPMFVFAHDGIQEEEFLALVEYHVDRQRSQSATSEGQVAIGLATGDDFRSRDLPEPSFMKTPLFTQLRSPSQGSSVDVDSGDQVSVRGTRKYANSSGTATGVVPEALVKRLSKTMSVAMEKYRFWKADP